MGVGSGRSRMIGDVPAVIPPSAPRWKDSRDTSDDKRRVGSAASIVRCTWSPETTDYVDGDAFLQRARLEADGDKSGLAGSLCPIGWRRLQAEAGRGPGY